MSKVLREQLININPWLEDDQVEEVARQLTASFPGTGLIENNKYVLHLLLENTSVSENRNTGEQSPTVRFIDFDKDPLTNNRFIRRRGQPPRERPHRHEPVGKERIAPPEQLLADGLREGSGGTEKKVRKGVSPVKLLQPVDNEASSPACGLSPDDESFHDRPPD